jgi:ACS family hexuronate transporter-like MFS transporter
MTEVEQSMAEQPAAGTQTSGAWKWWLAGVLFLATVLTYLDRQTLAVCKKDISEEFGLSNEQYGELLASFRWTYALMQLPAGMMADRFSLRMTYGLAVGLWSLAGGAAAFVVRYPVLLITRGVLGTGESFNWPCASRIVANSFPPSDRSLASGIFNSGAALGSLIAPTLIGYLARTYGWRTAFFTMGALGSLWLVLWFSVTTRRSRSYASLKAKWDLSPKGKWVFTAAFLGIGIAAPAIMILLGPTLLRSIQQSFLSTCEIWPGLPWALGLGCGCAALGGMVWSFARWRLGAVAFWMLMLVTLTVNPCWYFVNEWVIAYLQDSRQLDNLRIAGIVGTLVIATAVFLIADLGNVVSGGIIKFLTRRGWSLRAARGSVMMAVACMIAPVTLVTRVENTLAAALMLAFAGMGLTSIIACFTACQQDLSFKRVGVMSGVVGMVANIVSALANPRIGAYVDKTKSYSLCFILLGLLPMISVAAILVFDWVIHGKATKVEARTEVG